MQALTPLFLVALGAMVATRWWLAGRQLGAVRAHRDTVPAAFANAIPTEDHRRAADYTAARLRLGGWSWGWTRWCCCW
jgi:STE24 endopeptidase